jgi:DNA helicase-2/ATP-dependent DNA helicase PcrA
VGPRTVEKLWGRLKGRFNVFDEGQRAEVGRALRGAARKQWAAIEPVLTLYAGERTGRDAGEIMARFVDAFYDAYAKNTFDDYERRADDVRELVLHTGRYETAAAFLADVALLTNVDAETDVNRSQSEDAVHLSTIHQAKGLEWPVVVLIWACEGLFPSPRTVRETEGGEAEERRLFYVTVTRAKDELCVCTPEVRRKRDGGVIYHPPSRFVTEIPAGLFRNVRAGLL